MIRALSLSLLIVVIAWLLMSIHATTVKVCGTMDAECQINQESPQ